MPPTSRTLVTGFGPFGDAAVNPSEILASELGRPFEILEVSYAAVDQFLATLDPSRFETLVMLGLAKGRRTITPEIVARNIIGERQDVSGNSKEGVIDPNGEPEISSTLWNVDLVPITPVLEPSFDAGTYLCNYLSYRAIRKFPTHRIGFVHVPDFDVMDCNQQLAILSDLFDSVSA